MCTMLIYRYTYKHTIYKHHSRATYTFSMRGLRKLSIFFSLKFVFFLWTPFFSTNLVCLFSPLAFSCPKTTHIALLLYLYIIRTSLQQWRDRRFRPISFREYNNLLWNNGCVESTCAVRSVGILYRCLKLVHTLM